MAMVTSPTKVLLGILIGFHSASACFGAELGTFTAAFDSIRIEDLRGHVNVLASDTFEGREAGTRGGRASGVYIGKELRRLGIQGGASDKSYYQEFGYEYRNILGLLPGSDPKFKNEIIVVCAHYDHVGYGTQYNSRGPIGRIHNGADDNGSGISGLLEVIEALSSLDPRPKRSILFAFWDAEEKGLLGSRHWIAEPTVSLNRVKLTVNSDMIGRVRDRNLDVYGTRTASGLRRFVSDQLQGLSLRPNFTWEIRSDSDHYPFFKHGVPILMLHSGKHGDYHRPSDDADKLNYHGLQQVTRLAFRLVFEAAERPVLPTFRRRALNETKVDQQQAELALMPPPPRFGIKWDDRLSEQRIVKVTAVTPGSAAGRAGLEIGDRIVEFAGHRMDQWEDFRTLVLTAKNPVRLLIERESHKAPLALTVQLDGKPTRLGIAWRVDDAEPGCVILRRVIPGSPAALAELKVNDRIREVDGHAVTSSENFYQMVSEFDSPLDLVVERRGTILDLHVKLVTEPSTARAAH